MRGHPTPVPPPLESPMSRRLLPPLVLLCALACLAHGQDAPAKKSKKPRAPEPVEKKGPALSVEELAARTKPSLVVILHTGRQGKQAGLGTGFVVDKDGLIA